MTNHQTGHEISRLAVATELARLRVEGQSVVLGAVETPAAVPPTLADVERIFARWLRDDDAVPTRAVLAAYVANQLDGDPVWLMLVGGSGVGKTERLVPLGAMSDVVLVSSITGPAALLSGTKKKERADAATGGLLRTVPNGRGVLVLKDFTSILEMHREARAELLAALREICDGRYDRVVGTDGGQTLTWTGRLGIVAGCTTAIDSAHGVHAAMGTRFVLCRLHPTPDLAAAALDHVGREVEMRHDLRLVVRAFLDHASREPHPVDLDARRQLAALSSYVARARSPVDRDQGEISLVLDPEAPTRLAKMLGQLWRACGVLGLDRDQSWGVVRRVGLDSIPKLRGKVLDVVADHEFPVTLSAVADLVEHPSRTTRRAAEDLVAHGAVRRHGVGGGKADTYTLTDNMRAWRTAILTVPEMSAEAGGATVPETSGGVDGSAHGSCEPNTSDDKSGKAGKKERPT